MKTWDYNQLEKSIAANKSRVEKILLTNKPQERLVRRRPRDKEEQEILDRLCLNKWKDAENKGEIKYLSKNEWCYEY
ncbi:hypothetical protein [Ferviditalea candida]|uniref:Uncharacterized protein n=1 Tax=Ferviditalea candida TaxID=3108399 RepID=A0ABU5ZLZ7_9BACL|nr:hypothetical protein [Paenibacillaceae bacterium T2]